MVEAFASVPQAKLRYQQLLHFAQELSEMDDALKTEENLVRGCQSVVFVNVTLGDDGLVTLEGDSDAQLTKGLVAILVRGFTGATPEEILGVDDSFLVASGVSVGLTPARNNGFASMLAVVKRKVRALVAGRKMAESNRPTYEAIVQKLGVLEPVSLDVVDETSKHASHIGVNKGACETHFDIEIVSPKFQSLSLIDRHRIIYKLLEEEVQPGRVHALTIKAKTPAEAQR